MAVVTRFKTIEDKLKELEELKGKLDRLDEGPSEDFEFKGIFRIAVVSDCLDLSKETSLKVIKPSLVTRLRYKGRISVEEAYRKENKRGYVINGDNFLLEITTESDWQIIQKDPNPNACLGEFIKADVVGFGRGAEARFYVEHYKSS